MLVKVREEGSVREVLEARCVVGHVVGVSGEVLDSMVVTVGSLVVALVAAEQCRRACGGDSTLEDSGDRWGVVSEVEEAGVGDVMLLRHDVDLG